MDTKTRPAGFVPVFPIHGKSGAKRATDTFA
jgi:hypothetical protein